MPAPSFAGPFDYREILESLMKWPVIKSAMEPVVIVAAGPATTENLYWGPAGAIRYNTVNATANWTANLQWNANRPLNSALRIGQAITFAHITTQGVTAYYPNVVKIDGVTVTPKYQGGTAWTAGNASGLDVYTFNVTKTADRTFLLMAAQSQFK